MFDIFKSQSQENPKWISKISTFQYKLKEEASLSKAFIPKQSIFVANKANKNFSAWLRSMRFTSITLEPSTLPSLTYPVMTGLVVGAETYCGCSVPLHSCEQSSKDLKVCVLTGRNLGPSPQYFARGNHFHSSAIYRKKNVTMVPETREKDTTYKLKGLTQWQLTDIKSCVSAVCTLYCILPDNSIKMLCNFEKIML